MGIDIPALSSLVETFRASIEPCWSKETAYRVPNIATYGPYISGGQCAVTCLVLMDVLREHLPHEKIFLISGQVQSTTGEAIIDDHSWLRIGVGDEALLIDPTPDQAKIISDKTIIGTAHDLTKKALRYIEKDVEENHGAQEHPNRFARYVILKNSWQHKSGFAS